ncbi:hypothetical protein COB55_00190 [Candidatus Wolfebacteria bacterium]|nr:MAG: hypothetical protein COB55_00190 [Candidatus Wolfebacteria bacterium]
MESLFRKIKKKIYNYINFDNKIREIEGLITSESDKQKLLLGKLLTEALLRKGTLEDIHEAEFSIFSQGGDDGIIQYLISKIDCPKTFVDIGGGRYTQPDTRFLLQNNNWSGIAIDGSPVDSLKNSEYYPFFDIEAKQAFVTVENINDLIKFKEVGLLNIDIDGNDYWIWEAIKTSPTIVVIEYNPLFGLKPITIPYEENFVRTKSDYGTWYCGASLTSLCDLAEVKGYSLVGCSRQGINAFFVRKDKLGELRHLTPEEGFVNTTTKECRDKDGKRYFMEHEETISFFLKDAPFYNTRTGKIEKI